MTREEEAILRARSRWTSRERRKHGSDYQSVVVCSDGVAEVVAAPWRYPPSNSADWSWARRTPDWDRAHAFLIGGPS